MSFSIDSNWSQALFSILLEFVFVTAGTLDIDDFAPRVCGGKFPCIIARCCVSLMPIASRSSSSKHLQNAVVNGVKEQVHSICTGWEWQVQTKKLGIWAIVWVLISTWYRTKFIRDGRITVPIRYIYHSIVYNSVTDVLLFSLFTLVRRI